MINKILRSEIGKEIFRDITDDAIDTSYQEHRRGSSFFTKWIFEINKEWFPNLDRKYDGFWETNQFIWSEEDYDRDEIWELNRVELKEKTVVTKEWIKVL